MKTQLKTYFEVFGKYKYLLANLIKRDINVKYRRSALGLIWSILNPFLMMLIMTAVFSYVFKQQIEYFPVYMLSGQLMFNFFSEATNIGMESILGGSALIKKVYIPKYLFPLEKVSFSFINAMFSLVALFIVILFMGVPLTPWILLFPLPFIINFIFNLGVSMVLASLVVFFRDVKHLYGVVIIALTYLTPLFYPESILPARVLIVAQMNPMYWFVAMLRRLVLYGEGPTSTQLLITCSWALGALVLGSVVLKKTQDRFILYM